MQSAAKIFTQFLVQNVIDNALLPVAILGTTVLNSTSIAVTSTVSITGNTNATTTVSNVSSFTGLVVGASISGSGIPAGATIAALNPASNTLTLSVSATTTVTSDALSVSAISGIYAGATIQGVNIPNGTTVASVSGSTIVISLPATGAMAAGQLIIQAIQNSNAYWQGVNTGKQALLTQANAILTKIQSANGKLVTQVTIPGQGTSFQTELSLFDQAACYSEAYNILAGNTTVIRRTTGRYF